MNENKLYQRITLYFFMTACILWFLLSYLIFQRFAALWFLNIIQLVFTIFLLIIFHFMMMYIMLIKYLKKFDHHPKLQIFCHHQSFIPLPHQDIAMFLYLHKNHSTYHSMNIASLLGLDFQQRQTLKMAPDQFCEYILNLEKQMNEDHLIEINGKFLSIYTYSLEHEFLGIIIDRTQDMIKKTCLINQLKEVEINSQIDSLTKVYNRRGFELHVQNCLCLNCQEGVMMALDVDNFKSINDNYGHQEGDKVLQQIAQFLTQHCSLQDIIGRIGGDEFLIFIPHTLPMTHLETQLKCLIQKLQKSLGHYYHDNHVSMSIGVVFVGPTIHDYHSLYHFADMALYQAKKSGKNKYYIYYDYEYKNRKRLL